MKKTLEGVGDKIRELDIQRQYFWLHVQYIRVQRFKQLGSPRPMTVAKFNSKTQIPTKYVFCFFELFRPLLTSKFSANIMKNARVSQNAEFDADFESVENVAKRLMRKTLSATKGPKNGGGITFITVCKSFLPITSFG